MGVAGIKSSHSPVTPADVAEYRSGGAVRIPRLIDRAAVGKIRALAEKLARIRQDITLFKPPALHVRRDGTSFCEFVSREFCWIRDQVDYSRLASAARLLAGSKAVFFWRDELFSKDPESGGNSTPWHNDIGSLPFKGRQLVVIWTALTDIDEFRAPLRTIRRSWTDGVAYRPPLGRDNTSLLDGYEVVPDFDASVADGRATSTVWSLRAGDAIAFSAYTVHGSLPNRSKSLRHAYVTRWLGDDVVWAPDAYSVADETIEPRTMLRNGRPLPSHFDRYE